jgi:plasmid stability protein
MAQLLVRNIEGSVRESLRRRAKRHGRNMAEELREILRAAAAQEDAPASYGLGTRISARFAGLGLTGDLPRLDWRAPRAIDFEE